MLKKVSIPFVVVICLINPLTLRAQNAKTPLKNGDIIEMLKAGLPESTIILAIKQGPSNFDTSAQGLIQLKKDGASPQILEAILKSSEKSQVIKTESRTATAGPENDGNDSGFMEIFLLDGANKMQLKQSSGNANASASILNPFGGSKVRHTLNGNHAQIRITNTSPMFELMLPSYVNPSDHIIIVKLTPKSDRREIEVGRSRFVTFSTGFREKDIMPTNFEELPKSNQSGYKLFRVKVTNPLSPGEYAFVTNNSLFYDFGVDSGKY